MLTVFEILLCGLSLILLGVVVVLVVELRATRRCLLIKELENVRLSKRVHMLTMASSRSDHRNQSRAHP